MIIFKKKSNYIPSQIFFKFVRITFTSYRDSTMIYL